MSVIKTKNTKYDFLLRDIAIFALSVWVALMLAGSDIFIRILTITKEMELLGSFIAGMFFTSVFTTAPAIVTLGELARANSLIFTAIFGGMGAVVGDLIIFRFVKDRISEDIIGLIKHNGTGRRVKALFKLKFFKWFTLLLGGLIIASPLPDEIGISLLGLSKIKNSWFIVLSFVLNTIGILLIGLVARSL